MTPAGITYVRGMVSPDLNSDEDDGFRTHFTVGVDDVTLVRLLEVCEAAKLQPALVIAAIVRDVMEDDAGEHDDGSDTVYRRDANHDLH